jgi:hypothetical protein
MINAAKFREVHRHAAGLVLGEPLGDRALEQKRSLSSSTGAIRLDRMK